MNDLSLNAIPQSEPKRAYKVVYTIVERQDKKYWVRIGSAFNNHDGSMNVRLDASPTNGQLQIRDPEPYGTRRSSGGGSDSFPGMGDAS